MQPRRKLPPTQYGSITGRNTTQAWNYVLKIIMPKQFVAEFDIAKCYDSIQ